MFFFSLDKKKVRCEVNVFLLSWQKKVCFRSQPSIYNKMDKTPFTYVFFSISNLMRKYLFHNQKNKQTNKQNAQNFLYLVKVKLGHNSKERVLKCSYGKVLNNIHNDGTGEIAFFIRSEQTLTLLLQGRWTEMWK